MCVIILSPESPEKVHNGSTGNTTGYKYIILFFSQSKSSISTDGCSAACNVARQEMYYYISSTCYLSMHNAIPQVSGPVINSGAQSTCIQA